MKKNLLAVIIGCLVLLSSCVQSLYPLTENKNKLIFKHELLGQWKEEDGTEYIVDSLNAKLYHVSIIDHEKNDVSKKRFSDTSHFLMTLVNIHGKYFLDCLPDTARLAFYKSEDQAANFLLPVHYILKLNSISKTFVEIASIDNEQLLQLFHQKKFSAGYETIKKDQVLLVQKPRILQQKLTELEKFPTAYRKSSLQRQ